MVLSDEIFSYSSDDGEDYYKTNNSKLGIALIFNHRKFKDGSPDRFGAEKDMENLNQVLIDVGFDVRIFEDNTKEGIEKELIKGRYLFMFSSLQDDIFLLSFSRGSFR